MAIYIQYICKNSKCDNIFLAEDIGNWSEPQKWRYCPECEAKGFEVIRKKPITENLANRMQKLRSKKRSNNILLDCVN